MTAPSELVPRATDFAELTPRQVVEELDRYIIGQDKAKRAVAIALRNRWRRRNVSGELKNEILPNNIIMIGPTGVGKTEIARRLARLAGAPFVKVEASKFTEVGYVGRDVESMVRDLVEFAVNLVRTEREDECRETAASRVEERLLDLLLPPVAADSSQGRPTADEPRTFVVGSGGARILEDEPEADSPDARRRRTREKLRGLLRDGKLEEREVDVDVAESSMPSLDMSASGMEGLDWNFMEVLQDMLPKRSKRRTVTVAEARKYLLSEELDRLVDMDEVVDDALDRAETMGIIFLDELDKVATKSAPGGPDVSREGVQRDLLPIVEGSTVQTKYGFVNTDHMLFIAAGAFHLQPAIRPDSRAAGTVSDPGGADQSGREGLRPHPARAQERAPDAVPGSRGHRGGDPRTYPGGDRGSREDRRRCEQPGREHRCSPPAHGPYYAARRRDVRTSRAGFGRDDSHRWSRGTGTTGPHCRRRRPSSIHSVGDDQPDTASPTGSGDRNSERIDR